MHEYAHMVRTQEYFLDIISKSKELNIPIIVAGNNHPNTMPKGFNLNLLSGLGGGVAVRIELFATVNKNTVIDNVAFNLIFKDEINHVETPVHGSGESV